MINVKNIGSAKDFSTSKEFSILFENGMDFVKEVSNYLDNIALKAGIEFNRDDHLKFTKSSMILTTSLIQLTSWLVVMKSISQGNTNYERFSESKFRLNKTFNLDLIRDQTLPEEFRTFAKSAKNLFDQITIIDGVILNDNSKTVIENTDDIADIDVNNAMYDAKNIQDFLSQAFLK